MTIRLEARVCPCCGGARFVASRKVLDYDLVRCIDCSMVYCNPGPSRDSLQFIYQEKDIEQSIALYERIATERTLASYDTRLAALERVAARKGRLLDFGCAAGYFVQRAQVLGWDAYGLDFGNWVEVAAARRHVKNVKSSTLSSANFESSSFDVIHSAQVFEHLVDPSEVLDQLVDLLKPGGIIYIDVPNYKTLPIIFDRDDFVLNSPPQHINYFTPDALSKFVRSAGLTVLNIAANDGLKWENLLGRPIDSEIAEAYDEGSVAPPKVDAGRQELFEYPPKSPIRKLLDLVFYNKLRLGMNLYCYARKAES